MSNGNHPSGILAHRAARCLAAWVALGLAMAFAPAAAGPVTVVGGFDHFIGPLGQTTDGVLGAVVLGAGGGDVMVAGVGFDDRHLGRGYSLTGGVGAPLAPGVALRAGATRFVAGESFRAWRTKLGPQLSLPGGRSLTLSYLHYRDDYGARSNGAMAEAASPLVPRLTGRASGSYATAPAGPPALQGSLGLGWTVVPRLELSCEAGLARNSAGATGQPVPRSDPLGLPLLGGGGSPGGGGAESTHQVDATLLLGVRVTLP